jgi:hypothetical protein
MSYDFVCLEEKVVREINVAPPLLDNTVENVDSSSLANTRINNDMNLVLLHRTTLLMRRLLYFLRNIILIWYMYFTSCVLQQC